MTWEIGPDATALSGLFNIESSLVVPIRWEGVEAVLLGSLDDTEHQRRQRLGIGAVRGYRRVERMYEDLLGLTPDDGPTDGPQEGTPDQQRPARPPLAVDAVVVTGVAPESTVRRASYFAPVARRIALLTQRPRDLESARLRAAWLEVGLVMRDAQGELLNLVPPGERHGQDEVFRWWFSEVGYDAHLKLGRAAHRHPAMPRPVGLGA